MPSNEFRIFSAFFLSPDILNNIFLLSPSLSERFFGVSSATNLPLFIIITLSQTALISLNICELKITVFSFPSSLITFLISIICLGSRPTVGSSSIRISGSPIKKHLQVPLFDDSLLTNWQFFCF